MTCFHSVECIAVHMFARRLQPTRLSKLLWLFDLKHADYEWTWLL